VETIEGVTTTYDYVYDVQGCTSVAGAGCTGATDTAGRLTDVAGNGVATAVYGYDANGNRINGYNKSGNILAFHDAQDRLSTYKSRVGVGPSHLFAIP